MTKIEQVRVFIRFDRVVAAEHLGGLKTTREATVFWPRWQAEKVASEIERCRPGERVGFRCEVHGEFIAAIEELRIIRAPG